MHFLSIFTVGALTLWGVSAITTTPKPAVRREWTSLSLAERKDYIDAVLCLYHKPSKIPHGEVPGAINRRDDFTAVHINQTFGVHLDAVFLGWHRNFLQLYETALRKECGYKGLSSQSVYLLELMFMARLPTILGLD